MKGGIITNTNGGVWVSGPPSYIPPGGMCWRAPDGSYEWLLPKR